MSNSLQLHGLQPTRILCPWNSPGQDTEVSIHSLLQGIFTTQGSNPGLPYCRQILYHLITGEAIGNDMTIKNITIIEDNCDRIKKVKL